MGSFERFNLRWDGFEASTRLALAELREEVEFFDVTLVSGDGKQVKANKVILASGSSFFHKILRENPHPHPLIYLKDVKYKYLLSVLDFLYTGEANIAEEDLNQFLDIAEDLKMKGLTPSDQQIKPLPKTDTPLQSQMFAEENVPANSKTAPQVQVAAQEKAPVKSKTHSLNAIPAPQGEVAAQKQSPAKSLSSSLGVKPAFHQGQGSADETTSSSGESLRRRKSPNVFPNSSCEDDTCNVKVEVGDAERYNVFYGMDDQGEQYMTSVSNRDLHNNEKNNHYLRKQNVEHQNEDMELDQNDESISTVKIKEELVDSNNDTFHAKAVDSVVGNEDRFRAWCEENDGIIPAGKQDNTIEQDKNKNCDKDKMVDSKCYFSVTQEANIHDQPTHDWYEQVKDIANKTQEVEQDLGDEEFSSEERNFQCFFCNKMFASASTLKVHKRIHTGEKPYQCLQCDKRFKSRSHLNYHHKSHTGEKPHQCLVCYKKFSELNILTMHEKIHTGEKHYQCKQCSKSFSRQKTLNRHMKIHTGEKPYQCLVCFKNFVERSVLTKHERIHTGEKHYQCKQCSKSFSRQDTLNKHMRIHTGEKLYQCKQCSKSFSQQGALNTHMRIHTGEKPYQCLVCSKKFSHRIVLTIHERIHTGEKHYQCKQCSKSFSRQDTLNIHMRIHTGEKPYQCLLCTKSFTQMGNLNSHKKTHTREKPY